MEMKNKIIVCKGWGWLWLSLFVLVLLAGIGFFVQIPQGKDDFEKAFMGVFGTFISFVGCAGILINLFGEKRADEIWNWIYGGSMALLAVAFFGSLIVFGIAGIFGIKF